MKGRLHRLNTPTKTSKLSQRHIQPTSIHAHVTEEDLN